MSKQLGFHINSSVCGNCKACQIACQDKNNLPAVLRWRELSRARPDQPDGRLEKAAS